MRGGCIGFFGLPALFVGGDLMVVVDLHVPVHLWVMTISACIFYYFRLKSRKGGVHPALNLVCTLLVRPFHASAALFSFLLCTMSSFHSAWEDGLVPMVMIIAITIASYCGPFGTSSRFFAEDMQS
eukprot:Gb_03495 [translate_table: standard]